MNFLVSFSHALDTIQKSLFRALQFFHLFSVNFIHPVTSKKMSWKAMFLLLICLMNSKLAAQCPISDDVLVNVSLWKKCPDMCQFSWCQYSHFGQCQATNVTWTWEEKCPISSFKPVQVGSKIPTHDKPFKFNIPKLNSSSTQTALSTSRDYK